MGNKKSSCVIAKSKPGSMLAGLLWHPVTNEDPLVQERCVYEFSQSYETDLLVVAGNNACLQIGFPQGKGFERDKRRSGSMYAMACMARVLFQHRNGFLVWVLDNPSETEEVSVCLIEQDLIVLDILLTLQDAKKLVDSYMADQLQVEIFGLVSNNGDFFPNAELIDEAYLFGRIEQRCLLRKPRRPRNLVAAKRTRKELLKMFGFFIVLALIVFGMNAFYQKKKTEMLNRIKKTETSKYFDELKTGITKIGLGHAGISSLQARLVTYPLLFDGWQLDGIKCDAAGCSSRWRGQSAWSKDSLEVFGKKTEVSGDKKPRKAGAAGPATEQVQFYQPHEVALEGLVGADELKGIDAISDFCDRERLLLGFASIKWTCDTKGEPWPIKPKAKIEKGMVTEHKITAQGSVAMIDYVVKRYRGQVFWKEFSVQRTDEKRTRAESDFMQFQLIGAVYAKN